MLGISTIVTGYLYELELTGLKRQIRNHFTDDNLPPTKLPKGDEHRMRPALVKHREHPQYHHQ
jgi:hypothetical protein